ncbi:MAG: alcohol dehydrogenase catalytic domain-containing protein [Dehalococcoidia bacterium]|nr:alcohol dehydrogenase catalytic domain-containing protein [Dehalococcoidia bacterium]
MRAAAWTEDNRLRVTDAPEPVRKPGTTTVRVDACGICGTDLHFFRGELKAMPGSVPGHEMAGTVVESDVHAPGTLVAVEPLVGCGTCAPCRGGWPQRCTAMQLLGISAPGGLQELVLAPDANVYPVPAGTDPRVVSLAEPLAVAVRGVHLAEAPLGSRGLVVGSGTIGLMSLLLLRRTCTAVAATARYPHQKALAEAFGATHVFEPGSAELRAWARQTPPDVVVETVGGHGETLVEALHSVRAGGTVVVLGVFSGRPAIPAFRLVNEEIRVVGSVMYGRAGNHSEFGAAVALLPEVQGQLLQLNQGRFPLEQANEAFEAAVNKQSGYHKVTVRPNA